MTNCERMLDITVHNVDPEVTRSVVWMYEKSIPEKDLVCDNDSD